MRDDFNKEAMRQKIKNNQDAGWAIPAIREELVRERMGILKSMKDVLAQLSTLEQRDIELADQVEFMDEEYGKPS